MGETKQSGISIGFTEKLGYGHDDAKDCSGWKNKYRATSLVCSAGTFVNKTSGGFVAALVFSVLASYGYDGMGPSTVEASLPGMQLLMSWIPAAFSFAAILIIMFYQLTTDRMQQIETELRVKRAA